MAKSDLRVIQPDAIANAHEVIDLAAKTFGGFYDFRRTLRDWYLLNSHYDWKASAVGFIDQDLVTHFGVWDYQMRIGRSAVRCGGIGAVATDGEHRKKGLMAKTIPHSLQFMRDRGYDVSILFGIWDFYHQFGYVRAWNETTWTIGLDRLPKDLPKIRLSAFSAAPSDEITKLHNRHNATITGSAIRPTFHKAFCFFQGKSEGSKWKKGGKLAGHVLTQVKNGRLACFEATGDPDDILSVLQATAKEKQVKEISFETLPYDSPLARRLRQLTCRCERQYVKSGAAMIRIINLASCLTKIAPTLSDRLMAADMGRYTGQLRITGPQDAVTLQIRKGQVSLSNRPAASTLRAGHELAQLLIGTDNPMEICEAGKMRLTGEARRLVPVLFPHQHPQLHQADRY